MPAPVKLSEYFVGLPIGVMLFGSAAGGPLPKSELHARSLRALAGKPPTPGTNTLIITHFPNISEAFGAVAAGLADGEALILQPASQGDPTLVARVKIEEWNQLDTKQ
jgi:hypothetical protein